MFELGKYIKTHIVNNSFMCISIYLLYIDTYIITINVKFRCVFLSGLTPLRTQQQSYSEEKH